MIKISTEKKTNIIEQCFKKIQLMVSNNFDTEFIKRDSRTLLFDFPLNKSDLLLISQECYIDKYISNIPSEYRLWTRDHIYPRSDWIEELIKINSLEQFFLAFILGCFTINLPKYRHQQITDLSKKQKIDYRTAYKILGIKIMLDNKDDGKIIPIDKIENYLPVIYKNGIFALNTPAIKRGSQILEMYNIINSNETKKTNT